MPKPKTSLKAVILVGGPGTRLQPLTHYTPKSMVPVLNKPFLEHTIAYLKKYGIENIILTLSYLPGAIDNYFGDGSKFGVQLTYYVENEPLGTAGAIKNAEQHLNSTFVVLNGDVFTDLDIIDMLALHHRKGAKATIALSRVDNPCAFGVVETDTDKRVQRFIEKPSPDCVTSNWINAGIYILEPEVLKLVPANSHYMFENGLFPRLLELNEPVYSYPFNGYWLDMGTPEKYHYLNCDLLLSKTSSPLIQGLSRDEICCDKDVTIHPSARIDGPIVIGSNTIISQGAYIKGPAVIGPDCHVGEDASIEQSTLWSGIHIGAGTSLRQCVIGSNTSIEQQNQVTNCVVTPDYSRITLVEEIARPAEAGDSSEVSI
ncbi:sugar phosphate nucleotidyltransferase [Chloroflexota bacterium]